MYLLFQSVFYHATSWLQDCGVLQKMDRDIWMVHNNVKVAKVDTTGSRVLTVQETAASFICCACGLLLSSVAFMFEIAGNR